MSLKELRLAVDCAWIRLKHGTRKAKVVGGGDHGFIWFGPSSQWVEAHDGIYRSYERLDNGKAILCRLVGCLWSLPENGRMTCYLCGSRAGRWQEMNGGKS